MSRLPNAPLIEVIFELRWKISNQKDLEKYQFLTGDLYALIKQDYPIRKLLVPADIPLELVLNKPTYRFSKTDSKYPLIQFGPGVLSLHTDDENYFWNDYLSDSSTLTKGFLDISNFNKEVKLSPNLNYIDFIKLNFENTNVLDFINKNLNITIQKDFLTLESNLKNFSFAFSNEIDLGMLEISFNTGKDALGNTGLVIHTKLIGQDFNNSAHDILGWLDNAHTFTSNLFKEMTKGKLYESFKQN